MMIERPTTRPSGLRPPPPATQVAGELGETSLATWMKNSVAPARDVIEITARPPGSKVSLQLHRQAGGHCDDEGAAKAVTPE